MWWNCKRSIFSKITETACFSGWEFEADKSRYGVYVTRHWNWITSFWMFWIGCLCGAHSELRSVSSFCNFRNMTFHDITTFFSFLKRENIVFFNFQIILLRGIKACVQILFYFYSVDFSEPHPEEVISFFWRSVYMFLNTFYRWTSKWTPT